MEEKIEIFKALSDKNRLLILQMLSCGKMCACDIVQGLELTQPTVSHHMKILQQAGLVECQKKGKWIYYELNTKTIESICQFMKQITSYSDDCICNKVKNKCEE
ncbi:transcriptional regulator, ArsR family [Alkalithermobacter thermoalcaliphilus JW-YL-7 = DSM 7308]|uniref:Transcriptional regulator, ArsR family n=1 Tax=Alkalithermobacter thermoalcaliphilus JW-YL-7 = DSM 7308 TaxID=1121328 RepID=A0A150FN82_CLOPD|nr:transcriptional regulator, ArsR family [[Clostridium] paradoxum JW-YL-7 = DSM 7308]SHL07083.1 transcriptional regulator, ArsR family [[Clostridium] paradoxum JW-YL-7 = DSM 7308]